MKPNENEVHNNEKYQRKIRKSEFKVGFLVGRLNLRSCSSKGVSMKQSYELYTITSS